MIKRQRGVSLVELMVGVAISLILLAGVITVVVRITVASSESIQSSRLNQQLRSTMDFMTKELQRSGYVKAWPNGVTSMQEFDFAAMAQFGVAEVSVSGDCILYSYDLDEDGVQGDGSPGTLFEHFGFRFNTAKGAVEMKAYGDHDCDSNGWVAITDPHVVVTNLEFNLVYAAGAGAGNDSTVYRLTKGGACDPGAIPGTCLNLGGYRVELLDPASTTCEAVAGSITCLGRRKVEITLVGELASDADVTLELRSDVHLKNDHLEALLNP